jgi:hypothetical protein
MSSNVSKAQRLTLVTLDAKFDAKFQALQAENVALRQELKDALSALSSMRGRLDDIEKGQAPNSVWQVQCLDSTQKTAIWRAIEPKVQETVKSMVAEVAVKQVASDAVQQHVDRQTKRVDKLAEDYAKATEKGNADAERLLQRTSCSNLRMVNVGADYRLANRAKLVQKAQALIRQVNKKATVVDAQYRTSINKAAGKQTPQTNLVVTLQGPAAVVDTITAARKARKETKEQTKFPFCDRDLTPSMLQQRWRMENKLREWRDLARPAGGRPTDPIDIGAWIDYRDGRPVLLKRNKNDKAGDPRGAVQEWVWQPRDPLKPEVGAFEVAQRRARP